VGGSDPQLLILISRESIRVYGFLYRCVIVCFSTAAGISTAYLDTDKDVEIRENRFLSCEQNYPLRTDDEIYPVAIRPVEIPRHKQRRHERAEVTQQPTQ